MSEETLPKIKFRTFSSGPLKPEMKFSKSLARDGRKLKFQIGKPVFSYRKIKPAPKIGAIRWHFLIIDTLGSTEPDGNVRGKLFGSVIVLIVYLLLY